MGLAWGGWEAVETHKYVAGPDLSCLDGGTRKAAAPPSLPPPNLMLPTQTEPNKQQLAHTETRGIGIITQPQSPNPLREGPGAPTGTPFTQGLEESLAEQTVEL